MQGLLAIASSISASTPPLYSFSYDRVNADILGGGNMVILAAVPSGPAIVPLVQDVAGLTNPDIIAGIMSSKAALLDYPKDILTPTMVNTYGLNFFNYLSMSPFQAQQARTATIFRSALGQATIGFVYTTAGVNTIQRQLAGNIKGLNGTYVNPNNSLAIGAVGIDIDPAAVQAPALSQINPQQ